MALTKTEANKASGIDKKFLLAALLLQIAVIQLTEDLADDMEDVIMEHATANGLKDRQDLLKELTALLSVAIIAFDGIMEDGIVDVATAKKAQFYDDSVLLLRRLKAYDAANGFNNSLNNLVADSVKRFRNIKSGPYDLTFIDRIEGIESSTKKVLQVILENAVTQKQSASEVAKVMRSFIAPLDEKARPWDIVRKRFGITDGRIPADILPGSFQSNLDNITRTQVGDFFRDLTHETYKDKAWVDHFDWVLSRSHPKKDICDDLAKASPYPIDQDRPQSHNYCLCDWVAVMKSDKEIRELLANGEL